MALTCPTCEVAAAEYVGMADDGRNEMRCGSCGHRWLLGARPVSPRAVVPRPAAVKAPTRTRASAAASGPAPSSPGGTTATRPAPARFPAAEEITEAAQARLTRLKTAYRRHRPAPDPYAAEFRSLYTLVFSAEGLPHAEPQMLKDFANSTTLAHHGNVSVFNREWNRLGDRDAATKVRGVVEYLLRGDGSVSPEDRFTQLVDPKFPLGMTGFRESLLTRVLCVAEPERFLPILVSTSAQDVGKAEIARRVLDLELPAPNRTSLTVGRFAFRSNDLLVEAVGAGFRDLDDAATFLWWAKDQE